MAEKEGHVTLPSWNPKSVLDHASKPPSSNPPGKIPAKTEIKPFAGLPASQSPRPLKIEGH